MMQTSPRRHAIVARFLDFAASQADQSPRPYALYCDDNAAAVAALAARLRSAHDLEELAWLAALVTCVDHPTEELSAALLEQFEIARLGSATFLALCHALAHSGRAASNVVPVLVAALDESATDRRDAMLLLTLGRVGPEGAAELVERAMQLDPKDERRTLRMLEVLRRTGPAADAAAPKMLWLLDGQTCDAAARTLLSIDPHGDATQTYLDEQTRVHPDFADHWQGYKRRLIGLYPHWAQPED
jgi:hypothetical protein